jgi:Flp pilus assembly protein protease CpaA
MQEYYFLFALALIWTLFATIQDIRKREVSNWLNFSLIAFALSYRLFYSINSNDFRFFFLGFLGFLTFYALAHAFYYSRAFAGGDAKLMMGFGVILPYTNYSSLITLPLIFLLLLFSVGSLYSLIYSIFLVSKNKEKFKKSIRKFKTPLIFSLVSFIALSAASFLYPLLLILSFLAIIPALFIYTKSLDKCMIFLVSPNKLTEGDWLEKSVLVGSKTIKKTVHGLSLDEIKFLKKHNKKVLIKSGIPFVPAFFITLIIMVYVYLVLSLDPVSLLSALFS